MSGCGVGVGIGSVLLFGLGFHHAGGGLLHLVLIFAVVVGSIGGRCGLLSVPGHCLVASGEHTIMELWRGKRYGGLYGGFVILCGGLGYCVDGR